MTNAVLPRNRFSRRWFIGGLSSFGTSSLRYSGSPYDEHPPAGFENTSTEVKDAWKYNAVKMMDEFPCRDCCQGMLWNVYDDRIVVKRREFLSGLDLGDDWIMPLPAAESKPFAFAEHAKKFRAPSFPVVANLEVAVVKAKNRGGKSRDVKESVAACEKDAFKVVSPPAVADKNARLYKLEFVAKMKDGVTKRKLVLAEGFNHALGDPRTAKRSFCVFACDELMAEEVRFSVTPINCFGARGVPLVSEWVRAPAV